MVRYFDVNQTSVELKAKLLTMAPMRPFASILFFCFAIWRHFASTEPCNLQWGNSDRMQNINRAGVKWKDFLNKTKALKLDMRNVSYTIAWKMEINSGLFLQNQQLWSRYTKPKISKNFENNSHIEAEIKWLVTFSMHFLDWKCMNLDSHFTEVCP